MTSLDMNINDDGKTHSSILSESGGPGGNRMDIAEEEDDLTFTSDGEEDESMPPAPIPARPDSFSATEAAYNPGHDTAPREPPPDMPDLPGTRTAPEHLRDLWQRWYPGREPGQVEWSGIPNIEQLYASMGLNPSDRITPESVNAKFKEASTDAAACLNDLDRSGDLRRDNNDAMMRLIFRKIEAARQMLLGSCMLCQADTMQPSDLPRDDFGLWRFIPPDATDEETPSPSQRLRIFCLTDCMNSGFRRYRESFMQRIHTADGRPTCAWGVAIKIADYVRALSSRRLTNQRVWFDLTTGPGISAAEGLVKYFMFSDDPELPWLEPDRHVFSFRNGVYLAKDERFISYDVMHVFYGESSYPVACKHFDMDFDPAWLSVEDPMSIQTPALESIWDTQNLSLDVRRWCYALIGRLLYNVREYDDWQIFMFLKGLANTGKSTLLNYIKLIYEAQDVGTISNMVEKQFGIGQIAGMKYYLHHTLTTASSHRKVYRYRG